MAVVDIPQRFLKGRAGTQDWCAERNTPLEEIGHGYVRWEATLVTVMTVLVRPGDEDAEDEGYDEEADHDQGPRFGSRPLVHGSPLT